MEKQNTPLNPSLQEGDKVVKAFTLVELIVVITILAILATIGFVSFSGYLAGARDTNRIAQLKSMSDALELYRTKKSLPLPDDKVDIREGTTSTTTFAYQGYIGKNVLETIEYTESGLDPKDKEYFSYYLTKNKKYFQLMAFLEEEDTDVVALKSFDKTLAIDYSERFPHTQGRKLGIMTDENNTPIQELSLITGSGYLDILDTGNEEYKSYLKGNDFISGTGTTFIPTKTFALKGGKFCSSNNQNCIKPVVTDGLIAFYPLKNNANDEVGNYDGTPNGGVIFNGNESVFDGDGDYIGTFLNELNSNWTISLWAKKANTQTYSYALGWGYYNNSNDSNYLRIVMGYADEKIHIGLRNGSSNKEYIGTTIDLNKYYLLQASYNSTSKELNFYVNGVKKLTDTLNLSSYSSVMNIGGYLNNTANTQYMNGSISNVRIYDRVLSDSEIKEIYEFEKR